MNAPDYSAMEGWITSSGVNGTSWNTVLEGNTVNNKNKMLVVYGMALHIATDIFSHSAYNLAGQRISHSGENGSVPYAHDETYCSNRYDCAKEIAGNVLDKIINTSAGTVGDFKLGSYDNGTSAECFKLRRIATYIKTINNNYYQNNKSYFDNMAVSSVGDN